MTDNIEAFLIHHGVKGMKWGKRSASSDSGSSDAKSQAKSEKKAAKAEKRKARQEEISRQIQSSNQTHADKTNAQARSGDSLTKVINAERAVRKAKTPEEKAKAEAKLKKARAANKKNNEVAGYSNRGVNTANVVLSGAKSKLISDLTRG